MNKRKNEYGTLKTILMYPMFKIVDASTSANLQLKACVEFIPGEYLPDFSEAYNTIRQKIEAKNMTVEKTAEMLIDLFNEYEPKKVFVRVEVINNNSFFPVIVTAESGDKTETEKPIEADTAKKKQAKKKQAKKKQAVDEDDEDEETEDDEDNDDE